MDKYLISLAFVLLFAETGWLLNDLHIINISSPFSDSSATSGDSLGEIVQYRKDVRRKSNDSLVWEETQKAQPLYAYDSILTLDQSSAEIKLGADTQIKLNENTLVTIEPLAKKEHGHSQPIRLHFKKGSLRTVAGRAPQSIEAGGWVIETKGDSNISVRSDKDKGIEVETLDGQAQITNPKGEKEIKTIEAGHSIVLGATESSDDHEVLKIQWSFPKDGERLYTHTGKAEIGFSWEGKANLLTLFEHESSKQQNLQLSGVSTKLRLALGNYTARLTNAKVASFAKNFSVWPAPKIHLLEPLTRERIDAEGVVELSWTGHPDVALYTWQIATDAAFTNIVRSGDTIEHMVTLKDLPNGEFYWRVLGQDSSGFKIPEMYFNTFYIIPKPLSAPKLKNPSIKRDSAEFHFWRWFLLPRAEAADNKFSASFQWDNVPDADSYVIEISSRPDFKEDVQSHTVRKPEFKWQGFKPGVYYWRVAAQNDRGGQGLFSEVAVANLTSLPKGPVTAIALTPEQLAELSKKANEKEAAEKAAAATAAAAVPTPTPIPTPLPEKKIAKVRVLKKIDPEYEHKYSVDVGGHGEFIYFKGKDFTSQVAGLYLGDVRFSFVPPRVVNPKEGIWRVEGEFNRLVLRINNPNAFPFQDPITRYTFKLQAVNESLYENEPSFGVGIGNQVLLFQRADLEALTVQTPLTFGMFADWKKMNNGIETDWRMAGYMGAVFQAELSSSRTWYFKMGQTSHYTLGIEGKLKAGAALDGSVWGAAEGMFLLGAHW